MAGQIIMTSSYPEMTRLIEQIASELNFPVTIVEDTMEGAARKVAEISQKKAFEVVVSRAGTAQMIANKINLPIVHCDSSDFDLMEAFLRAKKIGDKICFLTYPEKDFPYNIENIKRIIGFDVTLLPYRNWKELLHQIEVAEGMGMEVVVGGGTRGAEVVKQYGMKSMYIVTSERTIKRSLIRASDIARYRIMAREKAERLNAVIHVSEEGIMLVGRDGTVETFNPAAERIFSVDSAEIIQKKSAHVTHPRLRNLLNEKKIFNGTGSLTADDLIVSYEPVSIKKKRVGTVITFKEINKIQQLERKIRRETHAKGLVARWRFSDIQYESKQMGHTIKRAREYASTDSTILIYGESGTGKELFAQGIHNASERQEGPFVAVNCAAFPETLLESELFGYEDGAFTGAKRGGRAGVFELAHGGTIFLDEIGEISLPIQARLLRVLQEKEVMRVGGSRVIPVNFRVVAATNRNLWQLVQEGKFRADLYFRLNVLRLAMPPLRKRREDIPVLVDHFLKLHNASLEWKGFSDRMRHFFLSYNWPGNVRQLENIIERYRLSVQDEEDESALIEEVLQETNSEEILSDASDDDERLSIRRGTLEEMEKEIFSKTVDHFDGNRTLAAESLGVSRTTLWKKLNN